MIQMHDGLRILIGTDVPGDDITWRGVCLALGALVGWGVGLVQKRYEIKKLQAESVKLVGDQLLRLQTARREHDEACADCTRAANRYMQSLKNSDPRESLDAAREELCASVSEKVVPRYLSYMEWEQLDLRGKPDELKRLIDGQVVAELDRIAGWLRVINLPKVRDHLCREPLIVTPRKVERFRQLARDLPVSGSSRSHERAACVRQPTSFQAAWWRARILRVK